MPKHVVSTATLKCGFGSAHAPLICAGLASVGAFPSATVDDHVPGVNIFSFGTCSVTGDLCVPITPSPWTPTGSVFLHGAAALRASATLACTNCGIISVVDPGQHDVDLDAVELRFTDAEQELIEHTPPSKLMGILNELALAGASLPPPEILERALKKLEKDQARAKAKGVSPSALADFEKARKILKALHFVAGHALDALSLAEVLREVAHGDWDRADRDAGVLGAAVLGTAGCEAVVAGPAAVGLGVGELAGAVGCAGFGVATGVLGGLVHDESK
jgi:hypothetical protein